MQCMPTPRLTVPSVTHWWASHQWHPTPLTKQGPFVLQVLCFKRFRARMCLRNLTSPLAQNAAFTGVPTVRNAKASRSLAHTTPLFYGENGYYAAAEVSRATECAHAIDIPKSLQKQHLQPFLPLFG